MSKKRKSEATSPDSPAKRKAIEDDNKFNPRPEGRLQKIRDIVPKGMNISRKSLRKEMRKMKKSRRHAHYTRQPVPTLESKLADQYNQQVARQEAAKLLREKQEKQRLKNAAKRLAREERKKAYESAEKLRIEEEEEQKRVVYEENREIKQLEKQLHMNKRKSKLLPQKFIEEGLDYILDAIDPEKVNGCMGQVDEQDVWTSNAMDSGDDEQSEDSSGESEEELGSDDEEIDSGEEEMGSGDGEIDSGEEMDSGEEEIDSGEEEHEDGDTELREDDDDSESDQLSGSDDVEGKGNEKSSLKEDIYGRLRDSAGNIVTGTIYVPPARRMQLMEHSGDDAARKLKLDRLKKQLQGQLNRLSESNMLSITKHIETLYREQSRADMNFCLRELVAGLALTDILTPERLSMELAMLIALLHNNIGTEIGATFLETLTDLFNSLQSVAVDGSSKKIHNITAFLCHLYSFQVTHSLLIVDIMNVLIESFRDTDIELILIMLKSIGFTLRKDDPAALREIIVKTQHKANAADIDSYNDKSRVKFMLEIVLAIKNNNIRKMPNYDTSHMQQLKKLLKGYIKGGSLSGGQLRIAYKDLLEAKDKGKWWVVGSAWQGSQATLSLTGDVTQVSQSERSHRERFSHKLLEQARKQRMNTETRRNIFCTLMSADDFVDAFEKLLKLGLKSKQEREIITVIIECCTNEATYNSYYSHLLIKFISYHRRFLFTFQTSMWDRFKIMSTLGESCVENLAQLTGQLVVDQTLPLSILKNLEFGELNRSLVRFLKSLLLRIFKSDKKNIIGIFYKVGLGGNKLKHVKEGLELYMHHFLLRKCKEGEEKTRLEACVTAAENGLNLNKDAAMF